MTTFVQSSARGGSGTGNSRLLALGRAPGRRAATAGRCAALAVAALAPVLSQAAVPPVDPVGKAAVFRCGSSATGSAVNALHADKIVFRLIGGLQAVDPADQPVLNQIPRDTELDIKVSDNPKAIADLRGKVLSFIGAVDNPTSRSYVRIISVSYALVCPVAK